MGWILVPTERLDFIMIDRSVHIRSEPEDSIAAFYKRLSGKREHSKVIVAASAKLKIAYWVLKEKRPYHG